MHFNDQNFMSKLHLYTEVDELLEKTAAMMWFLLHDHLFFTTNYEARLVRYKAD
jgi:hypothetical protein